MKISIQPCMQIDIAHYLGPTSSLSLTVINDCVDLSTQFTGQMSQVDLIQPNLSLKGIGALKFPLLQKYETAVT